MNDVSFLLILKNLKIHFVWRLFVRVNMSIDTILINI